MIMIDFDIEDVLNELEDLSTQEKIKALNEIYDQLEEAMSEVLSAQEEIAEQYNQEKRKQIDAAIQKYVEDNSIQNAISIENGVIGFDYKDFGVCIQPHAYMGEWELSISLTRTNSHWKLEEIAKTINVPYKKNNDIHIPVSEDELIPKILEILQKLLFNQIVFQQ